MTNASDKPKRRVGILFGGKSAEHEVSVQSARNVLEALDKDKYEPLLIGIDRQGRWHQSEQPEQLLQGSEVNPPKLGAGEHAVTMLPGSSDRSLVASGVAHAGAQVDVIFPILHGPMGEDGTVQGFLELANVPYVGCGVLGSAVGMDKDIMKRLLREAGIPITDSITLATADRTAFDAGGAVKRLGLPLFVKPANMGSSVGVSKVKGIAELLPAIDEAFLYDTKIILEKAVVGDEVECAVLGNDEPEASLPGRIMPRDFYSYEAKYIDEDGAVLEIPAKLPENIVEQVRATALKAFRVLACEGMARMDMFVTKDGQVIFNEVNTIPGFTNISMYPKLWEASGLSYTDLISRLLELAVERYESRRNLRTTPSSA